MIKNLANKFLVIKNANFSLVNKCQNGLEISAFLPKRLYSSKTNSEEDEFQEDKSFGTINLENVGLLKKHLSWPQYNRVIYPPTEDGTPMKNPFCHHMRNFIKYSPQKLWYPAFLIRGMSIDEAVKQLSFHKLKGAAIIKEVLLEAQQLAVNEHNFEFKSNMWISQSLVTKAMVVKGLRKHRAGRVGEVEYKYCHYFVRLEEGQAPKNHHFDTETYEARAKEYIEKLRKRTITLSI